MTSHWESSTKSLFVRTVLVNGRRHAILNENDPHATIKFQVKKSKRASNSAKISKNSPTKRNSPVASENMGVSSVKVYLAGYRSYQKRRSAKHPENLQQTNLHDTISINVVPPAHLSLKTIVGDFSLDRKKATVKDLKVSGFSTSLDCSQGRAPKEKTFLLNCNDQYNALSDRVIMWLDLATQTIGTSDVENSLGRKHDIRNRISTALVCTNLQKRIPVHVPLKPRLKTCIPKTSPIPESREEEKKDNDWDNPILSITQLRSDAEDGQSIRNVIPNRRMPLITSRREHNDEEVTNLRSKVKLRMEMSKRQLHIFIPNISKRLSDCASNFSSMTKSSSAVKLSN